MSAIPEKPFFRVNEVCRLTDTQPYVLRFWESEFPQLSPDHHQGSSPLYRRDDVELIFRIKQLLYDEEYTIAGARQVLSGESAKAGPATRTAIPMARAAKKAPPRQLELDGLAPETTGISKERYDDAVDEITHLRLQLADAENRLRRADHDRSAALEEAEALRDRNARAIGRLEAILERLRDAGSPA